MTDNFFLLIVFVFVTCVSAANADVKIRDPSAPLLNPEEKKEKGRKPKNNKRETDHTLSSIFIGEDKKIAVINSKQYREGDLIGAYKVKQIESNKVILVSSLKKKILELYPVNKSGFFIK